MVLVASVDCSVCNVETFAISILYNELSIPLNKRCCGSRSHSLSVQIHPGTCLDPHRYPYFFSPKIQTLLTNRTVEQHPGRSTMATLNQLIQALPPELFDHIQDLLYTSNENDILIRGSYTPSHLLHVNSATGQTHAGRFYGCSTQFISTYPKSMLAFLCNVSEAHRGLIMKVGIRVDVSTTPVTANDCRTY